MTRAHALGSFVSLIGLLAGCGAGAGSSSGPPGVGPDASSGSNPGSNAGAPDAAPVDNQPVYPSDHPRIFLQGDTLTRLTAAVSASTTAWKRFHTIVDQWVGGADLWGFDAWNAALVGNLVADPKYCTAAIASADAQVTAANTAIAAGSAPAVAGDDYLQVGPMVGDVALVFDWCYASVTSAQRAAWITYMNQAVSNVWHPTSASWGGTSFAWNGWGTNDPADNYYYSFLRATMLVGLATRGDNDQADAWLEQFRTTKLANQAFPTFDSDLVGGGSREGTSYGVSMRGLWELYDWWYATTGEQLAILTPHTRASLLSAIHQTLPTLDRVAPTGDQARDSTAAFFDYNRQYLAELVQMFPNDPAAGPTKTLLASSSVPAMTEQFMAAYDFIYDDATVLAAPLANLATAYYASGIGELYARSGWDTHATWVNLIGGPYTESHAHQDQGSLMLYKDGWLAVDAVIASRSGLRQETTAHGLVRIDSGGSPVRQVASTTSQLRALHHGTGWLHAAVDVTAAYAGASAIENDVREVVYLEPDTVVVYDRVASAASTTQTWQLPTPVQPAIAGQDATIATTTHTLHVHRSQPATATAAAYAMTSDPSGDYSGGYRLDEAVAGGDQRYLHVLSIDGAVASLTDATDTVTLHLADGRTVVIAFSHDGIGGSITIDGTTTTLAEGVDPLPQ